jgi:pimeloyl-ACP methyl ester carboxylesterase
LRSLATAFVLLTLTPACALAVSVRTSLPRTDVLLFHYRAHDGVLRRAWLLLPTGYHGERLPLVISPHGRGTSARANERLWGDLPGLGDFAVVNPAGEGRRLGAFSWGDPGQIADLARMPALVRAQGVNVDSHRVYAVGGSMGGQETLLLLARYPRLLAGAAAFDPGTDMARRYWDFAGLHDGRTLQRLAREEIGGTPLTDPAAYAARSPDTYVRRIALSGVPLLLYGAPATASSPTRSTRRARWPLRSAAGTRMRRWRSSAAGGVTPRRCAGRTACPARSSGSA